MLFSLDLATRQGHQTIMSGVKRVCSLLVLTDSVVIHMPKVSNSKIIFVPPSKSLHRGFVELELSYNQRPSNKVTTM